MKGILGTGRSIYRSGSKIKLLMYITKILLMGTHEEKVYCKTGTVIIGINEVLGEWE